MLGFALPFISIQKALVLLNALKSIVLGRIMRRMKLGRGVIEAQPDQVRDALRAIERRRGFVTREDLYYVRMQVNALADVAGKLQAIATKFQDESR